jgi:hypothetical protein
MNLGARWGWMVNATPQLLYPRERDRASITQEPGWASGPVWTGAQDLAPPPGFQPPIVQPVASCCTNYAILAIICFKYGWK